LANELNHSDSSAETLHIGRHSDCYLFVSAPSYLLLICDTFCVCL